MAHSADDSLSETAKAVIEVMVDLAGPLDRSVARLDQGIRRRARKEDTSILLMTIPGIGPISAAALASG